MAAGLVGALKYTPYNSPIDTAYTKSFTASARTQTTATQAGYPAIPTGFIGVFAGFSTNNAALLAVAFDANASGSERLVSTRNVSSSALNDRPCDFYNSLLSSALIQDERNL